MLNLVLLVGGYGLGQGGLFLVNTWLLAKGQVGLIAQSGLHIFGATLGLLIVDCGASLVLAREAALAERSEEPARQISRAYLALTPLRLAVAVLLFLLCAGLSLLSPNPFTGAFAAWAAPALLIWALNPGGLLDGLHRSGVNGLATAAPYVLCALVLVGAPGLDAAAIGMRLGLAVSLGSFLGLAAQVAGLRSLGLRLHLRGVGPVEHRRHSASALAALAAQLPGQAYFRIQLLVVNLALGPAGAGLLLYGKQIVVGCAQLIGFLRRIEFPHLVNALASPGPNVMRSVLSTQRRGAQAALVSAGLVLVGGLATYALSEGDLRPAGLAAALFAPMIVSSAYNLAFLQGLAAQERFKAAAMVSSLEVVASLAFLGLACIAPSLFAFAAADLMANIVSSLLAAYVLVRPARSQPSRRPCFAS